jgi:U3 small nucleolar RNA-associated protein 14
LLGEALPSLSSESTASSSAAAASNKDTRLTHGSAARLRKQLELVKKSRVGATLSAPLEEVHQQVIQRDVGYKAASDNIERWQHMVTSNREKDTIQFPLNAPARQFITTNSLKTNFNPQTDLEKDLAQLSKMYSLKEKDMRSNEQAELATREYSDEGDLHFLSPFKLMY